MSQFTFQLKQDLVLPATGNPNKGYLLFPKAIFGLSYEVKPNPKKKILQVLLGVAELANDELVWPLTMYTITDSGFSTPTVTNQAEIDAYISTQSTLLTNLETLDLTLSSLNAQAQVYIDNEEVIPEELAAQINVTLTEMDAITTQLSSLVNPEVEYLVINRYDDVINYFKGDGSLTEEGIEWAKTVYYGDYQLGDLII